MARDSKGRVVTPRSLSSQQFAFVNAFLGNGWDEIEAARTAGYEQPQFSGQEQIRNPRVWTAIQHKLEQRLHKALDLATRRMVEIIREKPDSAAGKAVQVQATRALQARADALQRRQDKREAQGKDQLSTLTVTELKRYIDEAEQAREREAKTLDISPGEPVEPDVTT